MGVLRNGTLEYMTNDAWKTMRNYVWNSEAIGQVITGVRGEVVNFQSPMKIAKPTFTAKVACSDRTIACPSKGSYELTLVEYQGQSFKYEDCDVAKWVDLTQDESIQAYLDEQASMINYTYAREEDSIWVKKIISKVSATTLAIGGNSPLGATISSANALMKYMITEVRKQASDNLNQAQLAVGVSMDFKAELEALYGGCCTLGAQGMNETISIGSLGVMSLYELDQEVVEESGVHMLVYPYACAIKAYGCEGSDWSDGTGQFAKYTYFNYDPDFVCDFAPYENVDDEDVYVGLKYIIAPTP